jgi:hypothetical protein
MLLLACFLAFSGCSVAALPVSHFTSDKGGGIKLRRLYFNLYTDSLKPVLNYYVNVEGETADGNYLPLDTTDMVLTASWGQMRGNEWVIPKVLLHDSVTFTATSRRNVNLSDRITIWIQKRKDPRDAPDYLEPGAEDLGTGRGRR